MRPILIRDGNYAWEIRDAEVIRCNGYWRTVSWFRVGGGMLEGKDNVNDTVHQHLLP